MMMCGPIVRAVKESIHNGSDNWSMWVDRQHDQLADIFWDDIYNARWPESREWIRMNAATLESAITRRVKS